MTDSEDRSVPETDEQVDEIEPGQPDVVAAPPRRAGTDWSRVLAYGVVPALALMLALAAGVFTYVNNSAREGDTARIQSVQTATASAVAILSYTPDKAEQLLDEARNLLTGPFRDSYSAMIEDVVIPGAKQQQISATATVLKAGSVSVGPDRAVVLLFVNQTVRVGKSAPRSTPTSISVTLDKVGDGWLISAFTPEGAR